MRSRASNPWVFLYGTLFALFVFCAIGSFVMYFLNLPYAPQPETGHVYAARIHGGYVYFTKGQYRIHSALEILAVGFAALYVLVRLRISRAVR